MSAPRRVVRDIQGHGSAGHRRPPERGEMSGSFPIRAAADLMDAEFLAKWTDRAALSAGARAALTKSSTGW